MNFRTDLAFELRDNIKGDIKGVSEEKIEEESYTLRRIKVTSAEAEKALSRKMGEYITFEIPALYDHADGERQLLFAISNEIKNLLEPIGTALVIGLGNRAITPDALGPKTTDRVLATRHIKKELKKALKLENLRDTAVLSFGVVGQTGIETFELINSVKEEISPSFIIAIDALCARNTERLGNTIQISNTGISPGAGVANNRGELSKNTLGIPVIAIGVPTVVDAVTLINDYAKDNVALSNLKSRVVTPTEIDLLIDRASSIISKAINLALHPKVDSNIIESLI